MRNRTAAVYIALLLLLLAAVLGWMCRPAADLRIHTEHSASRAEIMTGRDSLGSTHVEFLPGERIDLNTADAGELQRLPGIGSKRAEAIVAWRESHGPFTSCRQLLDLQEISTELYMQIEDHITVG